VGTLPAHFVRHNIWFATAELGSCCDHAQPWLVLSANITKCKAITARKERKKKTTRFGINLMRSQVFYRAAQDQHSNVNKKQAIFTGNECAAILFEQQMFAHGLSQSSMHCITSEIFKHFLPL